MHSFFAFFALPCFLRLSSARALWVPDELRNDAAFWAPEDFTPLARRADICHGLADYSPCGNPFPLDFCCPTGAQCLTLNTTSNIQATLCCPAGQDCQRIAPVSCDIQKQNTATSPGSGLHSNPPTSLEKCGASCCPMGYACQGTACVAQTAAEAASSSTISSTLPTTTPTSALSSSAADSTNGVSITTVPLSSTANDSASAGFNGKSFAAGFIPGIVIGAFIAAGIIILMLRKERRKSGSHVSEKHYSSGRDTLTDLGPDVYQRPTVHGRSISEPTVDMSMVHRTDFLNLTPPREVDSRSPNGYAIQAPGAARGPATPPTQDTDAAQRSKGWFSHSPFVNQVNTPVSTQSPVPAHLKRGTLSFHISPIRALKKQKSMHSLRRQMTNASARSNSSVRRHRPENSRTGSTETIKVLMATPDQAPRVPASTIPSASHRPQNTQPPASAAGTWETLDSTSEGSEDSTPIDTEPNTYTPTKPGRNSNIDQIGATLSSPYTPSNYPSRTLAPPKTRFSGGLMPPESGAHNNARDSTFSAIMEKVGLRKTTMMGYDPRDWNKK